MTIVIKNIKKRFEDKEVLKGISFEFERGKINMIIGASGSGKTVLTKCMVRLMEPDEGEVYYDGINILQADSKQLRQIRRKIGMLFQSAALFDSLTVAENVAFPLRMFTRWSEKEIMERVRYCLHRVNLYDVENLYPGELSGGMKKRVGIARAIVFNPTYLFCDEPNSGLDPKTAAVIDDLIKELTEEMNTTTVVISHDIRSVMQIGDKILFLYNGRKEWEGHPSEIRYSDNPHLIEFIETSGVRV